MDYKKHYDRLMARSLEPKPAGIYIEHHHIIPRCMGGTDEANNLAYLTAAEHYVAHQLLVKMYPKNKDLLYAAQLMTVSSSKEHPRVKTNKLYQWIRTRMGKANRGKPGPQSAEHKAKRSAVMKGRRYPHHLQKRRPEWTENIRKSLLKSWAAKKLAMQNKS